ncbi:clustered-asparagine-rich protein-like [Oppia nitens]|uniref:clustered-asparagine-rich protein-like n=1 Tax=Oppia nitens TaxID=1686743 RepID=UPI0023DC2B56|nr:clustered-asparagine-rich protein-like [Oppia nitens]
MNSKKVESRVRELPKPCCIPKANKTKQYLINKTINNSKIKAETKPKVNYHSVMLNNTLVEYVIASVDQQLDVEESVKDILLEMCNEFVDNTIKLSVGLAKNRKSKQIDVKDVGLALDKRYNMQFPEFGTGINKRSNKTNLKKCNENNNNKSDVKSVILSDKSNSNQLPKFSTGIDMKPNKMNLKNSNENNTNNSDVKCGGMASDKRHNMQFPNNTKDVKIVGSVSNNCFKTPFHKFGTDFNIKHNKMIHTKCNENNINSNNNIVVKNENVEEMDEFLTF